MMKVRKFKKIKYENASLKNENYILCCHCANHYLRWHALQGDGCAAYFHWVPHETLQRLHAQKNIPSLKSSSPLDESLCIYASYGSCFDNDFLWVTPEFKIGTVQQKTINALKDKTQRNEVYQQNEHRLVVCDECLKKGLREDQLVLISEYNSLLDHQWGCIF